MAGTYQLLKTKGKENGKARLQYMYQGIRYSNTVRAKNDREAQRLLALFISEVEKGKFVNTDYTFSEFAQIYLNRVIKKNNNPTSIRTTISILNVRVLPYFGSQKLQSITKQQLEEYFNDLKTQKTINHGKITNKTLSQRTIINIKNLIFSIFKYAVECEIMVKNPCYGIKIKFDSQYQTIEELKEAVNKEREKIHYFDLKTYKNVCSMLEKDFMSTYNDITVSLEKALRRCARLLIILLALKTGMRRSEIFAMAKSENFNDLNLKDNVFDVNKSRHGNNKFRYTRPTKNKSSIRIKSFPRSLVPYIKLYYKLLDYLEYDQEYIFDCVSIEGISKFWKEWQIKNKIFPVITFHDLRHTHATILLALGVDMKTISERLGHSNIKTTFNIYVDVVEELDKKAVAKIDSL